jgi:Cd2+/Zn2+-exporting ATPase/Cu+-exporting ATPase
LVLTKNSTAQYARYNQAMANLESIEISVQGMDCAECTLHVKKAIAGVSGVQQVDVYLASEKAIVSLNPEYASLEAIRAAVREAGYSVPAEDETKDNSSLPNFTRPVLTLLGIVFGVVLFVVVVGEWLGLFEAITSRVPWIIGLLIVLIAGFPVFRNVIRATLKGQVIAHTLMSLGVIAALAIGEWATAAVVVFFMRIGDYAEHFTTERARRAVKDLAALAPKTARLIKDNEEVVVPLEQVGVGDVVSVRPGDQIPVDGEVVAGQATVDQATITGESMPVEVHSGSKVYAATMVSLGGIRVRATGVGADTTFGKVIRLVEEAEAHRADVQRVADRFSAWYLPVVAGIAALTFLIRRDPLATAAVLVVACSCSFALATPIAVLASIGAGAKRGLMIKGGKYLETLASADVLLIDKTGTLTLGKPRIVGSLVLPGSEDYMGANGEAPGNELIRMAASVERYSEHPLAEAVRQAAMEHNLRLEEPQDFEAIPGIGVRARVNGHHISVGSRRMLSAEKGNVIPDEILELQSQGKTPLFVLVDNRLVGALAAEDTLRFEVPAAIQEIKSLGMETVELLTGDNERTAQAIADAVGIKYRAELLPEDKIAIVREYQSGGRTVVMVGDGVNDAPALAQADVGIAMGAAGSDVAIEAAHIALMREDWSLVPQVIRIARRTMRVVRMNLVFTTIYHFAGLSLAALGFLPPIFAAAAQSFPDIGILLNSSRLLRQR